MGSLTQFQKSLIVGSILGDGCLRITPGRNDALLEINHSAKASDYVDWKYQILEDIVSSAPKLRRSNGTRVAYRFCTRQHPELTQFYRLFYAQKHKVIPSFQLDPVALAVWFMDDGSKCRKHDVCLNTQQFCYQDQEKLVKMLAEFGLRVSINKDKIYYRLRFLKESVENLNRVIDKFIVPSMRYKLSYDPVET